MDQTRIEELQKELILGFRAGRIDGELLKEYSKYGRSLPTEFKITKEISIACARARVILSLPPSAITIYTSFDLDLYKKQVEESDGFYVDPKASGNTNMGIIPYDFDEANAEDSSVQHAKIAIETFNSKFENTHGKLEFVKLLNVTRQVVAGFLLYLTFDAKNLGYRKTDTYQSVVWEKVLRNDMPQPAEVLSFRLKPTPGSEKTWFWNNHRCGPGYASERVQTVNEFVNEFPTVPAGREFPKQRPQSKPDDSSTFLKNFREEYLKFKHLFGKPDFNNHEQSLEFNRLVGVANQETAKLSPAGDLGSAFNNNSGKQMTNTGVELSAIVPLLKGKTFTRSEAADLLIDLIRLNTVDLSSRDGETVSDIAQVREKQLEDKVGVPD